MPSRARSAHRAALRAARTHERSLANAWLSALNRGAAEIVRRAAAEAPLVAAAPGWTPVDADLFDTTSIVVAALQKPYERVTVATVNAAMGELGFSWEVTNPLVGRMLDDHALRAARVATLERDVATDVLRDAWTRGLSVENAVKELRSKLGHWTVNEARSRAATEIIAASNGGSLASVRMANSILAEQGEEPIALTKSWLSTADNHTRPTHVEADGQTRRIDEPFDVGGHPMMYPGDPAGPAEETINCRCTVTYDAPEEAIVAANEPQGAPWRALFALEGVETSDRRLLAFNGGTWRDLPLTLMAMLETSSWGHDGAEVAGRIDAIERRATGDATAEIWGEGSFTTTPFAAEVEQLVGEQTVRGVSVDTIPIVVEVIDPETGQEVDDMEDDWDVWERAIVVFVEYELGGATVCAMPAFEDAHIEITAAAEDEETEGEEAVAAAGAVRARVTIHTPDARFMVGARPMVTSALVAGLAPAAPPRAWFEEPEHDHPTPLTVNDDGQVYGHLAAWESCHTGFLDRCVAPPKPDDYDLFHLGAVRCDDGTDVHVGQLTIRTKHADLHLDAEQTKRHYDHTGTVVADLVVTNGEHGVWTCGAVRPDVDEARVRELRAAKMSGDWRPINGRRQLVGVLGVNIPGFAIPRMVERLERDGDVLMPAALVAAGIVTGDEKPLRDESRRVAALIEAGRFGRGQAVRALVDQARAGKR